MNPQLVLGSGSPRRAELLREAGFVFEIRKGNADEAAPQALTPVETAIYLAQIKAEAFHDDLADNEVLLTCDTEVWFRGKRLGKPEDAEAARDMLSALRNNTHQVISGVSLVSGAKKKQFAVETEVVFANFSDALMDYYIAHFKPFDKAGGYGIQEWFGLVGVKGFMGSYTNVIGLPIVETIEALAGFGVHPKWGQF
jgi:septum formation protein